ncbi:hypothetical protein [Salinigranum salinum]|uniref:hypothetical protein n=1 Tax=Salinigranum salinum TaxID=1364937 RepID=UPI0012612503|nr:hypothetical protein [Salinigranum salinum]
MRDCPHCSASFEADDEVASLEHLRDEHPDEFGPVDRRRLDQLSGDGDNGVSSTALLLGGLTVVVVGIVLFVTFGLGGSSPDEGVAAARTPSNVGGAHYHGTMEMVVLGDRVDFSQQEYQLRANAFHFEAGDGRVWHGHAEGVTLEWAMASLGIGVTETSVTFEGTTYDDSDPAYTVSVTVNGEPVDPATYVLRGSSDAGAAESQGDHVRIVVSEA